MTERRDIPSWLRSVPEDWTVPLLRLVARVESGHTPSRSEPEYWRPEECQIPWFTLADIWQLRDGKQKYLGDTAEKISEKGLANSSARLLPSGTVVLSRTASVGFAGIMPRPMATSQDFVNFVCSERLRPEFLLWVLRGMTSEFDRLRVGSTHKTIYMPDALQFRTPLPSLSAQRAIADFLDRKTAAVDELIASKEKLLTRLAEKQSALIHRAVTKGLDPDAPMKDSGVPWLGEIPEHWEVKRLKYLAQVRGGVTKGRKLEEPTLSVPYLRVANVQDGYLDLEDVREIEVAPREVAGYSLKKGDVLMNEGGDSDKLGRGCVWEAQIDPCLHQNHVFAVRPHRSINPYWINLSTSSGYLKFFFLSRGKQTTNLASISSSNLKEAPILLPPPSEQHEILCRVQDKLTELTEMRMGVESSIALLHEYRQSLITAAVTGQLPIPAEAA